MKPKDLSSRISDLESLLHHFSFEELTAEEAAYLKSTFTAFKKSLGNDSLNANSYKEEIPDRTKKDIMPALEYLRDCSRLLGAGPLTQEQRAYVNGMEQISLMLLEKIQKLSPVKESISSIGTVKELDFNLHHLLRNVLFISKTLTGSPALKISIDIDRDIPEIQKGDPSLLSRMLLHLFGKGIRYVDNGSIALRISMIGETKDISFLEFGLMLQDDNFANLGSNSRFKDPELLFMSFQKWLDKYKLQSEFVKLPESGYVMKFVLPFQKSDQRTSTPQELGNKSHKPSQITGKAPSAQPNNWNSLLLECNGDLKRLEERLNRWQGQLLGFVGKAKLLMKTTDFLGLEKLSIETRDNLVGIPFQDICILLERIARTCATDRDSRHLKFLYNGLLEEYGNMDRTTVSELKRLERKGDL